MQGAAGKISFSVTVTNPGEEPKTVEMTGYTALSQEELMNVLTTENKDGTDSLNGGA